MRTVHVKNVLKLSLKITNLKKRAAPVVFQSIYIYIYAKENATAATVSLQQKYDVRQRCCWNQDFVQIYQM